YPVPPDGLGFWSAFPPDRGPRVREAISAFESALFLNPDGLVARFGLAICLADPLINQVERARDIWREIAATSTNGEAILTALSGLAATYVERYNAQAFELLMALRNDTTNLWQRGSLNNRLRYVRSRLGAEGKLAPAEILTFAVDAWRTDCQLAEARVARG